MNPIGANFVHQVKSLSSAAIALLAVAYTLPAGAQTTSPPFFAAISVVPAIAAPEVTREIIVDGIWPNGCVPQRLDVRPREVGPQQLVAAIITPPREPIQVCTLATARFRLTGTFVPVAEGVQRVIIQTDDGVRGGEGQIITKSAASIDPLTPIITVVPDVELVNVSRTIVISGQHLAGCPYVSPVIDGQAGRLIDGVVIRLEPVPTLAPCSTLSRQNFRFELPYTPTRAGAERVIVTTGGVIRSESNVRTATNGGQTRAVGNITGAWYDPATNGSGLLFEHNFRNSDAVFGTWFLYDTNTNPRWLSIQNIVWQVGGTEITGDLFETRATAFICDPIACPNSFVRPARAASINKIGTARVRWISLGPYSDTQTQGLAEAFSPTGTLLFSSNISRLGL
jgi:hypothetical protein